MRYALLVPALVAGTTTVANAQSSPVGVYLCTTAERAAIVSQHREGATQPVARADDKTATSFRMEITRAFKGAKSYQAVEMPYDGPDRDRRQWQDDNSVLHSTYTGDGRVFHAADGPAFLTLGSGSNPDFYHAGFEHPGGEDTEVAVRWGRCSKVRQR